MSTHILGGTAVDRSDIFRISIGASYGSARFKELNRRHFCTIKYLTTSVFIGIIFWHLEFRPESTTVGES